MSIYLNWQSFNICLLYSRSVNFIFSLNQNEVVNLILNITLSSIKFTPQTNNKYALLKHATLKFKVISTRLKIEWTRSILTIVIFTDVLYRLPFKCLFWNESTFIMLIKLTGFLSSEMKSGLCLRKMTSKSWMASGCLWITAAATVW